MRPILRISALVLVASCGHDSAAPEVPASVTMSASTVTLDAIGKTVTLTAIVKGTKGEDLDPDILTWSSTSPSVASVADGAVTARSDGSATIAASATNDVKAAALVTVQAGLTLSVSMRAMTNAAVDATKTSASTSMTVYVAP